MAERPLVLHDADCGFCARCAGLIPRLGAAVEVSSIQSADLAALGVDRERARVEMPVVMPSGEVVWGHRAWAAILQACPPPICVLGRLLGSGLLDRPARAVYGWVAGHRHRLPGSDGSCSIQALSR